MKANYHTHTRWCRHGVGEIEDYILEAIRLGFEELAITEHVPHKDNIDKNRMQWEEFSAYDKEFEQMIRKYSGQIKLIKGFECEYYPEEMKSYENFRDNYGYELLILGQHRCGKNRMFDSFTQKKSFEECQVYIKQVCEGLDTGMFAFFAHPDVVLYHYNNDQWDTSCEGIMRPIFENCQKNHIPMEINGNGFRDGRRYPDMEAFRLSTEYQLEYLINADAHNPKFLADPTIPVLEKRVKEAGISVMELLPSSYYKK